MLYSLSCNLYCFDKDDRVTLITIQEYKIGLRIASNVVPDTFTGLYLQGTVPILPVKFCIALFIWKVSFVLHVVREYDLHG